MQVLGTLLLLLLLLLPPPPLLLLLLLPPPPPQCCSCVGWAEDAAGQVQRVCRVPRLVSHHFPFIVTRQRRLLTR
jgi:hypothetical protein